MWFLEVPREQVFSRQEIFATCLGRKCDILIYFFLVRCKHLKIPYIRLVVLYQEQETTPSSPVASAAGVSFFK
jgi:hypothetical protein